MKRILIVDDHPLTRKGLALTINAEPDLTVCGEAASAEEALALLDAAAPDLVVLDLSLPGRSGFELIKQLHTQRPALALVVVTRYDAASCAEQAIRAGARGYVVKQEAGNALIKAVRQVLQGGFYVTEAVNEQLLLRMIASGRAVEHAPPEVLSDRELEVFELTGKGLGTREIAERLHLSVKTVESYRTRTKNKLHLSSTPELMHHAVKWVDGKQLC